MMQVRYGIGRFLVAGWPRSPYSLTRLAMYQRLAEVGGRLRISGRALAVSHSARLCEVMRMNLTEIVTADYPEHSMLRLRFSGSAFDVVVSDQVLEHVEGSPQRAIDESFRVLRPGGIAVHTTCFINPVHKEPGDYWRFTADGLKILCQQHAQVIEAGQWGNRRAWLYIWLGLRGGPVPRCRWHPVRRAASGNNPAWPIVTWIVARKM